MVHMYCILSFPESDAQAGKIGNVHITFDTEPKNRLPKKEMNSSWKIPVMKVTNRAEPSPHRLELLE